MCEFHGLGSKKGKKGQHVGCYDSGKDLSAGTAELIERMDKMADSRALVCMPVAALPSSSQEINSGDSYTEYRSCEENMSAQQSTNASSNTSINGSSDVSTNPNATSDVNLGATATTNTSATVGDNSSATATTSSDSISGADSGAAATTNSSATSGPNSGATATTDTSATASSNRNLYTNGNTGSNHTACDVNKDSYKRKGSQMVLLERKKLKAQFPDTSENMTSAGLQGPQYVKLQFGRHHRHLRSRYELTLRAHLRDQIALGVTQS